MSVYYFKLISLFFTAHTVTFKPHKSNIMPDFHEQKTVDGLLF